MAELVRLSGELADRAGRVRDVRARRARLSRRFLPAPGRYVLGAQSSTPAHAPPSSRRGDRSSEGAGVTGGRRSHASTFVTRAYRAWTRLLVAWLALAPGAVHAAGFSLVDQGGRGLGSAYAGDAAAALDASTIAFNPAGLTRLPGAQAVLVGHVLQLDVAFEDDGSTAGRRYGQARLRGERTATTRPLGLAPSAHVSWQLARRWWLGLGFLAPFGFRTDYDRRWVGRYHAIESDLKTVELSPTVAVKLLDGLSLGGSLAVQYAHIRLSSALDLGAICELNLATVGIPPGACTALGLPVQSVDGFVRVRADSWALGWSLGLLYEVSARTRLGLSYRSMVRHEFDGTAEFEVPARAAILRSTGALRTTDGRFTLDLPEVVRLAVFHELDARWAVMAGVTWTHWARFDETVFRFDNPAQPTLVQPARWEDSFRYALGVARRFGRAWTAQLGTSYDESPVPGAALRTPRIPDSDRIWATAGIGYQATERLRVDLSYAHLFGLDSSTRNADPVTGHVLRGDFSGSADLFGVQIGWTFR
jgi:long-chain fatty acid transport protein